MRVIMNAILAEVITIFSGQYAWRILARLVLGERFQCNRVTVVHLSTKSQKSNKTNNGIENKRKYA